MSVSVSVSVSASVSICFCFCFCTLLQFLFLHCCCVACSLIVVSFSYCTCTTYRSGCGEHNSPVATWDQTRDQEFSATPSQCANASSRSATEANVSLPCCGVVRTRLVPVRAHGGNVVVVLIVTAGVVVAAVNTASKARHPLKC